MHRPQETTNNFQYRLYHQRWWFVGQCPVAATPLPSSTREAIINLQPSPGSLVWYKTLKNVIDTQSSGPCDTVREHGRRNGIELPTDKPAQFPSIWLFILILNFSGMLFLVWNLISSSFCYCSNDGWCFKKEVYSCLACMLLSLWIFISHSFQKLTILKNICWPEVGILGHTDQACWLTGLKKKNYCQSHPFVSPLSVGAFTSQC